MKRFALSSNGDLARYDYLSRLGPDRWAWEYLRRNPLFRRDALHASEPLEMLSGCFGFRMLRPTNCPTLAERWGLVLLPDPALDGVQADVVWNRRAFPDQLEVTCVPLEIGERCEIGERLASCCEITGVTDMRGTEYLLLRRNGQVIQLSCTGASICGLYPVRLKLTVSKFRGYSRHIRLQRALVDIHRDEECAGPRWTKATQILRDGIVMLDGQEAGMGRKEIAQTLYGFRRVREEWNGGAIQHTLAYLAKKAETLRGGAYLADLLGCEHPDFLPRHDAVQAQ